MVGNKQKIDNEFKAMVTDLPWIPIFRWSAWIRFSLSHSFPIWHEEFPAPPETKKWEIEHVEEYYKRTYV